MMSDDEIKQAKDEGRSHAVMSIVTALPIVVMVLLFFVAAFLSRIGAPQ